jgi:TRAP-type C4-dicarboxylate transport system permease small subunit
VTAVVPALKRSLEVLCSALAAAGLFAIMWLTLVDVAGRKAISTSVPGSLEMTEMLMVLVIFAGLPLVSLRGEHVIFDSLDPLLERWVRRAQGLVVELLCAAALAGVAWLMWVKAGNMVAYGDTSAQLKIPQGPFVYLMSVLCAVTALVHLLLIFVPTTHHHPGIEAPGGAA